MIAPSVRLLHAELEALTNPKRSAVAIAAAWGLSGFERHLFLGEVARHRAHVPARARKANGAQAVPCIQSRTHGTGNANSQEPTPGKATAPVTGKET